MVVDPTSETDFQPTSQATVVRLEDHRPSPASLRGPAGGSTFDDMEERVARLETHFEYVRRDLDELKVGQKDIQRELRTISDGVSRLPSSADLWNWRVQWTVIAVAAVALIVGGIIGGLAWLKPDGVPMPIIVQVPAPLVAPAQTPAPTTQAR